MVTASSSGENFTSPPARPLMPQRSPSLGGPSSGNSDPRRRSWIVAMDKVRRERREEISRANANRTDEEIAAHLELGLPCDAFGDFEQQDDPPVLSLRPQRRDSTVSCLGCGRPVCETPRRSVAIPRNDGGSAYCLCREGRSYNSDDEVVLREGAEQEVFLSPATSDRFVLEPPNHNGALSFWERQQEQQAEEELPQTTTPSLALGEQLVFRPRILLQPRDEATLLRSHSDPLTSPTPAVPVFIEEEQDESQPPQPVVITTTLPAPPVFAFRGAERNDTTIPMETDNVGELPLYPMIAPRIADSAEQGSTGTMMPLQPRVASAPLSTTKSSGAPLMPIDTPEFLRPTVSLLQQTTRTSEEIDDMVPPLQTLEERTSVPCLDNNNTTYETPTQPRRTFPQALSPKTPQEAQPLEISTSLKIASSNKNSSAA